MQEVQLNIAYRWFCGFELTDKIPGHSTSKTRLRRWNERVYWFCGIWSDRFKTGSLCKTLHWIVAMIPVPFIVVWNCWALQDMFQLFSFLTLQKSTAFTILLLSATKDAFCCPEGAKLVYRQLNCSQTTGKYLRCYQVQGDTCRHCMQNSTCFKQTGIRRRILGSSCYPAFYTGLERIGSDAY